MYGTLGQTNYAAAKAGIVGLTLTLAKEGERRNILCNVLVPVGASRMTVPLRTRMRPLSLVIVQ